MSVTNITVQTIRKTVACSSVGKKTRDQGINAIGDINLNAFTTGSRNLAPTPDSPIAMPIAMPTREPIVKPSSALCKLEEMFFHSAPDKIIEYAVEATSEGEGKTSELNT